MLKGSFSNMSSWTQLFFLLFFALTGIILGGTAILAIGSITNLTETSIEFTKMGQVVGVVFVLLIPACLCAYLFNEHPASYLKINTRIDLKFLLISALLIFTIQPLVALSGHLNEMIALPESMTQIENWMRDKEDSLKLLMEKILTTSTMWGLIVNILVIAVAAGITEEFFFRGSLQQLARKIFRNYHLAIWITAIIFSAIHLQFYGFFPRMLLGALLGYLFVWSGNLWVPVIIHSLNNALAVISFHFLHGTPEYTKAETVGTGDTLWASAVSLILSTIILWSLWKFYNKRKLADYNF